MSFKNVILHAVLFSISLFDYAISVDRPNIIIVLADDLGWNDVSFHGSSQIQTPNIDALAYNGIILNSHYVPALCTPSRASLLTGKYPTSMGMQHLVILAAEPWGVPLQETLMSEYFKKNGYATHAIGKWHLGFHEKEYTPTYRGFDTHYGYWNGFQDYYEHTMQSESLKGYDMRRGLEVDYESIGTYSTDLYTAEAINIIENHNSSQGPLFLYLSHLAPHAGNPNEPFQAPREEIAKHLHIKDPERRTYAAMVSKLDESLGKVVSALKNADMMDNSIILFMSDNGAATYGLHSNRGSNYPLRGMKETPWEGGVRGVAAIWSPLLNQTRRVSNQVMHMCDWLPTLYTAAGLNASELGPIDGMDMWSVISNDLDSPRTEVFNNYDEVENYSSLKMASWKYIEGTAQAAEFDLWYGESGRDGETEYEISKVFDSPTNIAISGYLTEKHLENYGKSDNTMPHLISQDLIMNLRESSLVTCEYPTLSSLSFITDNHNKVELDSLPKSSGGNFTEAKERLIRELEEIHEKHPFNEESSFPFSPFQRINLANLIETGEFREFIKCDPTKMVCLFNLEKDPCERINLAKIYPEVAKMMEKRLTELKKSVVRPLNQPDDPFANPDFHNGTWTNWCDVKREENTKIFMKIIVDSVSSVLQLDHFLIVLLENVFFKSLISPAFLIIHDTFIYIIQWFFWVVTVLICAVTVLYAVAALRRLTSPQGDPERKKSWTNWENLTFKPITNPTSQLYIRKR